MAPRSKRQRKQKDKLSLKQKSGAQTRDDGDDAMDG
jgi:hypothetical protein